MWLRGGASARPDIEAPRGLDGWHFLKRGGAVMATRLNFWSANRLGVAEVRR